MEPAALKAPVRRSAGVLGRGDRRPARLPHGLARRRSASTCGGTWKSGSRGGGYVFNNVHNIQAGVPPENIVALYDAAYEFGFYE